MTPEHKRQQEDELIYEYRVYEAAPGKMPELNARFRDHTLRIFERLGFKSIGYWMPEVGDYSDRLIYIVAFDDLAHRERAWTAFRSDPEWIRIKAESEAGGALLARLTNTILNPTDYSPLQ